MRRDKSQAYQLRLQGKSYKYISHELLIPLSTLSNWFMKDLLSKQIKHKLIKDRYTSDLIQLKNIAIEHTRRYEIEHERIQDEAIAELPIFLGNPLFISGLMLYWGEGDKVLKNGLVRLTNTEEDLIGVFLRFLLEVLLIPKDKIRVQILLYKDLNAEVTLDYWSNFLDIGRNQFHKAAVIEGKTEKRRSTYGICVLGVADSRLKLKILTWLSVFPSVLNTKVIV